MAKPYIKKTGQMTFQISLTTGQANYVNIPQCLSMINHDSFDPTATYKIKVRCNVLASPYAESALTVGVIPTTWYNYAAIRKAKALWQNDRMLISADGNTGKLGKWDKFRICLNNQHWLALHNKYPANYGYVGDEFGLGEWLPTELLDNDGNTTHFEFLGTGSAIDAFYVVQSYGQSIGNVEDTTPETHTNAYADFMPLVEETDYNIAKTQGDMPPFNPDNFEQELSHIPVDSFASGDRIIEAPLGLLSVAIAFGVPTLEITVLGQRRL